MKKAEIKKYLILHMLLFLLSLTGIYSKKAAECSVASMSFFCFYILMIVILGIYAIGWQQIIKFFPLSIAYANKAVTLIWGLVWGCLFFGEHITVGKMLGIIMVMMGIICYVMSDEETSQDTDVKRTGSMGKKEA